MIPEQKNTTEKSTLNKKPAWGGALVGRHHRHHRQKHTHFLHPQQQGLPQTQQPYASQQLVGGCLDSATFQYNAGVSSPDTAFKNLNANIDAPSANHVCYFDTAADDGIHSDYIADVGAAHVHPASTSQQERMFGMAAPDASTDRGHKSSTNIAAEVPHQARRTGDHVGSIQKGSVSMPTDRGHKSSTNIAAEVPHQTRSTRDHVGSIGKGSISMPTSIKTHTPRRARNTSMSSLTVRPTGTKDRHSKVRTAKGLRDRRVRLSAPTAIQFFDVQDRLGFDQPSKAVDWLIKNARAAIDELAPVEAVIAGDETTNIPARKCKLSKDRHDGSLVKVKDEEQSMTLPTVGGVRAESRAKARERARERAKEKCVSSCAATPGEATTTSAVTMPVQSSFMLSASPNVQLLPEFFLLSGQLRQPFDDQHHTADLSCMLPQSSSTTLAPHLPLSSHFFPGPPQSSASSFIYPGDVPSSYQFSLPPIYTNNTPISPRGTLQSIFSNPANSSMQSHMPMAPFSIMMGALQQPQVYGSTPNSITEDRHSNSEQIRQRSAELGSPDLHQHSRIPMRIHGMDMDSRAEETRITPSSMRADFGQ